MPATVQKYLSTVLMWKKQHLFELSEEAQEFTPTARDIGYILALLQESSVNEH